jgi:spermidine synthase
MLGMALGSGGAFRIARPDRGLCGALLLMAIGAAASLFLLKHTGFLIAAAFMAAATIPMGMIVPLLVAWVRSENEPARVAGALYAANTLGAALAILGTGFFLLPAFGNSRTLAGAAAFLAILAAVPLAWRRSRTMPATLPAPLTRHAGTILAVYFVSAFAAMVAEIGWIRGLILSIGSSTYATTLVLSVYVAGLGLGSAFSARFLTTRPAGTFGMLQLLISLASLLTLQLVGGMSALFGSDQVSSLGTFVRTALAASAVAILPPTFLVGACFPVALRWLGSTTRASGHLLATATAGSMVGALVAPFVSIPRAGIETTLVAALMLHALAGSLVLSLAKQRRFWPACATAALFAFLLLRPGWDVRVIQSGPYIYGSGKGTEIRKVLFARDDAVASVAVFDLANGTRILRIDGKTDASTNRLDLVTQLLTAHIPLALHGNPRKIALIGLGSGMTLASCLKVDPQRVDCMEISPAVVQASRFFDDQTGRPLDDPRVRLHVADARATLRGPGEPFDVILNEPSNLWIAGMAGLFTEEFYRTCRSRLAEGGLMGQWIHAYGITEDAFRDAVATFLKVFPCVTLWEMWVAGDYLLVGSTKPYEIDTDALARWLAMPAVREDLARIEVTTIEGFLGDLVASHEDLAALQGGARIQTDDGLHLEFTAPLGFYGRRRMAALNVLPVVDGGSLGRVVRGLPVGWAEARMFLRRAVLSIDGEARHAESIALLQEALRRFPDERQARLLLEDQSELSIRDGNREARAGRIAQAIEAFDTVPDESWWFPEARLRKIELLGKQSALPDAIAAEYRRILAGAPDHAVAMAGLAEILLGRQALDEADRVTARGVQVRSKSASLRLIRGRVLAALKKPVEAAAEWEEARRLDPRGAVGREAERFLKGP